LAAFLSICCALSLACGPRCSRLVVLKRMGTLPQHALCIRGCGVWYKRDDMQARLKTGLSCPRGPPPDAVNVSSQLVDPEPVEHTQNYLQQQTPKMKHGRTSVDQGQTPRRWVAQDDM